MVKEVKDKFNILRVRNVIALPLLLHSVWFYYFLFTCTCNLFSEKNVQFSSYVTLKKRVKF